MGSHANPIRTAGFFWLALLGALVATFCDAMHVQTGTLVYAEPFLYGQAWWPFFTFFGAFLWMAVVYRYLDRFLPVSVQRAYSTSRATPGELTESLTFFAFVYLLSGFGNSSPLFLSVLFYATFGVRFALAHDRAFLAIAGVQLAIGGTLSEAFFGALGLVSYTHMDFIGVPAWLPGLYLHGVFALRDGYRVFVAGEGAEPASAVAPVA